MSNAEIAYLSLSLLSHFSQEDELVDTVINALETYKKNGYRIENAPTSQLISLTLKWNQLDRNMNYEDIIKQAEDIGNIDSIANNIKNKN